jgi:hypothetical protein
VARLPEEFLERMAAEATTATRKKRTTAAPQRGATAPGQKGATMPAKNPGTLPPAGPVTMRRVSADEARHWRPSAKPLTLTEIASRGA